MLRRTLTVSALWAITAFAHADGPAGVAATSAPALTGASEQANRLRDVFIGSLRV